MSNLTEFHIGIDDTDSENGGCTTYTAAVLYQELCSAGFQPSDFPWLVRLNPNIPWKTRGNGALSIHLTADRNRLETIRQIALRITEQTSRLKDNRADPAVAFLTGPVPQLLKDFSRSALHDVLSIKSARSVARRTRVETRLLKGSRGLIGSLASIGAGLDLSEHTFEMIAYRARENLGTPRRVDMESVRFMASRCADVTFHNIDEESGRILVCPHGPDPVLIGIRGYSPKNVTEAFSRVRLLEPVERIMIFRTNQGTDAHLRVQRRVSQLAPYQSAVVTGRVETLPRVLRGGHVMFEISDGTGSVTCAAYSPTRTLKIVARDLLPGDRVRLYGGVRKHKKSGLVINLEKIETVSLVKQDQLYNPICVSCGGRCESMGKGQQYRCKKCGQRQNASLSLPESQERNLQIGTYTATVGARRHLTRPVP